MTFEKTILVVQEIKTYWTKTSRGGIKAVERNTVPEAIKIPIDRIQEKEIKIIHHQILFSEEIGFNQLRDRIILNSTLNPISLGGVSITHNKETVWTEFEYSTICGAPDRGRVKKTLKTNINEWAQIIYNGRFSSSWTALWWYEKKVVNAGLFEHLSANVFIKISPKATFRSMIDLF